MEPAARASIGHGPSRASAPKRYRALDVSQPPCEASTSLSTRPILAQSIGGLMVNALAPGLLELLCCPVGRDRLHAEDGHLVSVSLRRYPVRDGIPVLLPSGAEDAALASIVEAFRNRASSYYADNYADNRNPMRA